MHPQPSTFTARESQALRLLAEHTAVPDDLLGRLLGLSDGELQSLLSSLDAKGCVRSCQFLAGDRPWYWPSRRGLRLAGDDLAFRYREPNVRTLAHRRAIIAVRLHLATIAPQGKWLSERAISRSSTRGTHVPDGVLTIGEERHAIEVELTRKPEHLVCAVIDEHSARYNAVVYFCGPKIKPLLTRLRASGRWPNLRFFDLPKED